MKRSLAWMALAQIAAFTLQFVASVVLARYLTPYETGVYAIAAATVGALSIIQAFGLQAYIVRAEVLKPELLSTAFTMNAAIALTLAAAIASTAYLGAAFLHDDGVRRVLLVLAVTPLFGILDFLPASTLERGGGFKTMSLISTTSVLVHTLCMIALAVSGFSYMSIAYAQWARLGVNTALLNIVAREHVSFRLGVTAWRQVLGFGVQMMAVSGVNALGGRLAEMSMGRILGLGALGIYSRALSVNVMLMSSIQLVVGRIVFVDYAERFRAGMSLRQPYLRTVEIVTAVFWPVFAGCAVLAGPLISTIYGTKWAPSALPLSILAVAAFLRMGIAMTWELFAVTGNLRAQTAIEFKRSAVFLCVFVAGCMISVSAAAAAAVVDAIFASLLYRKHISRMTETMFLDLLPIYGRSALLTVAAVAPAASVMAAFHFSTSPPLSIALSSVGGGVVLWSIGLFVLRHPLVAEAKASLLRFSGGRTALGNGAS